MFDISFQFPPPPDAHECEATSLGDWIVYRCPQCSDYERWYNRRTGHVKTKGLKTKIQHWGVYHKVAPEHLH